MLILIAALVFLGVAALVVGLWWARTSRQQIRERLRRRDASGPGPSIALVDAEAGPTPAPGSRTRPHERLAILIQQAGYEASASDVILITVGFTLAGGLAAWLRTGALEFALLTALITGGLPVAYLVYKRHQRMRQFEQQFPEALDMLSRAMRSGHALTAGIHLVAEEMADPVGSELARVAEEIRLGLDPNEALEKLWRRLPTEDVRFFCAAIRIQRTAGGNLAEMLDRLSDVMRERFRLLSHARAISAQQRWAAIFVGLSPLGFAIIFRFANPDYFTPLLKSTLGPRLIAAGLGLELIGFFVIWRIARIKV